MSRILVLTAHRNPDESRINRQLIEAVSLLPNVTVHQLMREYPDFQIDVAREQQLLESHDVIVMMFPFYWYSSPAILSEWQDAVLTYGFAYGSSGDRLRGKPLQLVVSTGGKAQDYSPQGYNRYPALDLLLPFHAMANMTGMDFLPPFLVQGANAMEEDTLQEYIQGVMRMMEGF